MVEACTWIGETAAAGGVRTGIPLSGLRREECSWTVCPGPSDLTTYKRTINDGIKQAEELTLNKTRCYISKGVLVSNKV